MVFTVLAHAYYSKFMTTFSIIFSHRNHEFMYTHNIHTMFVKRSTQAIRILSGVAGIFIS